MKYKKLSIILFFLLSLIMISAVNATSENETIKSDISSDTINHDNNNDNINIAKNPTTLSKKEEESGNINKVKEQYGSNEISSTNQDKISTSDNGTFTELNNKINSSSDLITLDKDYKYTDTDTAFQKGIIINADKKIIIDGDGHTINAQGKARIFQVKGYLILRNLKLINGNTTGNGGAIYSQGNLNLSNCVFENNIAYFGGAVYIENTISNCTINSTFINNTATRHGGAIYFNSAAKNNTITGHFENNTAKRSGAAIFLNGNSTYNNFTATFYNNHAKEASAGGIFFRKNAEYNNFESVFRYNKAINGAGIFFYNTTNNNKFNSEFRYNQAESSGGAIVFYHTTNNNIFMGCFINNTALTENGGAITFRNTSKNSVFNCDFINNTAGIHGGGVNYRETPYNMTFNGNFINNAAKYGGGVNFFETFNNISFNGEFINNHADYGSGIATESGKIEEIELINTQLNKDIINLNNTINTQNKEIKDLNNTINTQNKEIKDANNKLATAEKQATVPIKTVKAAKTIKKSKKFVITATLKKAVKGKKVFVIFNGKTYTAKTNAKGIAKITIKKSALKKLVGKKVKYQVISGEKIFKKSVKVKK